MSDESKSIQVSHTVVRVGAEVIGISCHESIDSPARRTLWGGSRFEFLVFFGELLIHGLLHSEPILRKIVLQLLHPLLQLENSSLCATGSGVATLVLGDIVQAIEKGIVLQNWFEIDLVCKLGFRQHIRYLIPSFDFGAEVVDQFDGIQEIQIYGGKVESSQSPNSNGIAGNNAAARTKVFLDLCKIKVVLLLGLLQH